MRSEGDLRGYAEYATDQGDLLASAHGSYIRWATGCGAELWAQVSHENHLTGLNPHFSGDAVLRAALTARIEREGETELDGAFHAWADPSTDDPESGAYPFVFDSPDYDLHRALPLPTVVTVQLAAFAHELRAHESVEDYYADQADSLRLAAESFIPSGPFMANGESGESVAAPQAYAILSGTVLAASQRMNTATDSAFVHAQVRTLGGELDIVADPEIIHGIMVEGGVVSGSFWLSGCIIAPDFG